MVDEDSGDPSGGCELIDLDLEPAHVAPKIDGHLDEQALLAAVQTEGERLWHTIPEWHWTGKTLDEIVPPSYPVREAR